LVNLFTLLLSHGILALAAWRLLWRDDLDTDPQLGGGDVAAPRRNFRRGPAVRPKQEPPGDA
jgi:hypothetical protein